MLVLVGVPIGVPIPPIIISDGQHTPLFAMITYNRCREHNNIGSNATVSLRADHNRPHSLMTLSIDLDNLMITPPQYIWPRPRHRIFPHMPVYPFPTRIKFKECICLLCASALVSLLSASDQLPFTFFPVDLKKGICNNSDHRQKSFNCKNIL